MFLIASWNFNIECLSARALTFESFLLPPPSTPAQTHLYITATELPLPPLFSVLCVIFSTHRKAGCVSQSLLPLKTLSGPLLWAPPCVSGTEGAEEGAVPLITTFGSHVVTFKKIKESNSHLSLKVVRVWHLRIATSTNTCLYHLFVLSRVRTLSSTVYHSLSHHTAPNPLSQCGSDRGVWRGKLSKTSARQW